MIFSISNICLCKCNKRNVLLIPIIRSLVGCSFCEVIGTNVSYCFTHQGPGFNPCVSTNGTSRTNNGVSCNSNWISSRSCEQYTTCTDCLAMWPNNHYENSNVCLN